MSDTSMGTGRLFRSLRAEGASANSALPALTLDEAVSLRTMTLGTPSSAPEAAVPQPSNPPLEYAEVAPRPDEVGRPTGGGPRPSEYSTRTTRGVPASGVWLVVVGVTVVMGFADAIVMGRTQLGWLTGVTLLIVSIYGALVVRRPDDIVAVTAPPLAFFLATITAGQLTLPPAGGFLVREAFMVITTLGANALWIFGATLVALAIVLIRRRRQDVAMRSQQP